MICCEDGVHLVLTTCTCWCDVQISNRDTAPPPSCKSPDSRSCAFSLLSELCDACAPNFREMIQLVLQNHRVTHSNGENVREFEYVASEDAVAAQDTGYVGLRNLGSVSEEGEDVGEGRLGGQ